MTFCHNDFFFCQPVSCEILHAVSKKLSPVSCAVSKNCHQFHAVSKNCHQFHVQFQKKLSHFSVVVVKPSVFLQKKKNTITRCDFDSLQKNFFSSCKMLKLLPIFFFGRFFGTSLFFSLTFSQFGNFESTFYVLFFFVFSKFTPLQRILSNSNETENSFTENI